MSHAGRREAFKALDPVLRYRIKGEPAPVKVQWRTVPEPGVMLDGVWVRTAILVQLEERPHNTEISGQKPLLLRGDVKRVLVARGLAQEQTRGGVYAGSRLEDFLASLEWTPPPPALEAGESR